MSERGRDIQILGTEGYGKERKREGGGIKGGREAEREGVQELKELTDKVSGERMWMDMG